MKFTGWCLLGLGATVAAYWGLSFLITRSGGREFHLPYLASPDRFDTVALLLVAAAAAGVGALMVVFGGRGYVQTSNPSAHN